MTDNNNSSLWTFRARPVRIIDGDTLDVVIDQGFYTTTTQRIRLMVVDTPEIHSKDSVAALEAKKFTERWIGVAQQTYERWPLRISTFPDARGGFGRWLGMVIRIVDGANLSDDLLEAKQGEIYHRGQ